VSFILDALRKSESERQRDAATALARVPLATARATVPIWVRVALVLLTAAVLVLGGGWWQSMRGTGGGIRATAGTSPGTGVARSSGERVGERASAARSGDAPDIAAERAPGSVFPEGVGAPPAGDIVPNEASAESRASAEIIASTTVAPSAAVLPGQTATPTLAAARPAASGTAASGTAATPTGASTPTATPSAATSAATVPAARVRGAVPTMAEVVASGLALPPLTLELHVYHDNPSNRFVFINGGRYVEGQRLKDGPTVVEIRPLGVVLSQSGRDFLLLQQ